MKPSEFYEKYWKVSDGKGGFVTLPPLTQKEKDFLDESIENGASHIQFYRKRRRPTVIDTSFLLDAYKKLPNFLLLE